MWVVPLTWTKGECPGPVSASSDSNALRGLTPAKYFEGVISFHPPTHARGLGYVSHVRKEKSDLREMKHLIHGQGPYYTLTLALAGMVEHFPMYGKVAIQLSV